MTATAGWVGLVSGTVGAVIVWILDQVGVITLPGQGAAFVAAGVAFVVDVGVSIGVSMATAPKPAAALAGLVYSETPAASRTDPTAGRLPWFRSPTKLAGISLVLVIILNVIFR
jgi:SSS family solute:Na+ symporter